MESTPPATGTRLATMDLASCHGPSAQLHEMLTLACSEHPMIPLLAAAAGPRVFSQTLSPTRRIVQASMPPMRLRGGWAGRTQQPTSSLSRARLPVADEAARHPLREQNSSTRTTTWLPQRLSRVLSIARLVGARCLCITGWISLGHLLFALLLAMRLSFWDPGAFTRVGRGTVHI
jgi:hypothetical protein